jgi:large subunit ribosomal protein L11
MKTPPASYFLKRAAGIKAGAQKPSHHTSGTISLKHIYEIAKVKQKDNPRLSLEGLCKMLMGTCRSMGLKVVAKPE